MINGLVIGIVIDNADPDGMHRIMVEFPVDSGQGVRSSWCRMMSAMGGASRGLVMLPDIGTEVVLMYAYRSMTPYVLGAVYNGGADRPEPYRNDDAGNDKRVFWSRNDHMAIFDDTDGAEKVEFAAAAPTRLDVRSAPLWASANAAEKTVEEYSDGNIIWEAAETISFKCRDFVLETDSTIAIEAGSSAVMKAGATTLLESGSSQRYKAGTVAVNPAGAGGAETSPALAAPAHKHPPTS
ncbi:MAG: phage baseplate assembly protein V [Myxococcota bacterium]|nr:phage baseplate assembly protein V [Myxococcota bacterium]